jgi:two-component sensor histidine kinase
MTTPAAPPAATRSDRAYPGHPAQLCQVRADLRPLLRDCPVADETILCASELAANAALHSRCHMPGGQFTVCVEVHLDNYVWIEVTDSGGTWDHPADSTARGHGLDIIRSLATAWGIDGDYRGRTVWARIDWPTP